MRHPPTPKTKPLPPGPAGLPLFGSYFDMRRDPLGLYTAGRDVYGPIVRYRFGSVTTVVLNEPEVVAHVLVQNSANYIRSRNYAGPRLVTGEGLLVTDGPLWRSQRRQAQPAFHRGRLPGLLAVAAEACDDMLRRFERRRGQPVDLDVEMRELTLDVIGRWLSGTGLPREIPAVRRAIGICVRRAYREIVAPVKLPTWVPLPWNLGYRKARRFLDDMIEQLITQRRAGETRADDVLDILIAGAPSGTDDRALSTAFMTLLATGHETVAGALTWGLMHLSQNPAVAARVREEIRAVYGDLAPHPEGLERLTYTEQVVNETLRLCPPAWFLDREALEDDEIGGYHVPQGTIVGTCLWVLHRDPRIWPDPERFDPDRFVPAARATRHPCAHIPFGAGPRLCIGAHFGMQEVKLLLATILQRYAVDVAEVEPDPKVTLRPARAMTATLTRISSAR